MKTAIVVDYLNTYGGGERTLEAILEVYPQAIIFTSLYNPSKFRPESPIRKAGVRSFLGFRGIIPKMGIIPIHLLPKHFTFLTPFFFERLDLSGFDLIISLGTIWAKGVKVDLRRQKHIFYCLTPPRFLYGYPSEMSKRNVWYYRPFTTILDHWLRIWDFNAAQKPNEIWVISEEVKRRVKKFYRRDSKVIYPPVESRIMNQESGRNEKKYYLIVSRLAAYKGIDVALEACNELKLPLRIVGTGKEEARLKRIAGPTVEFLGFRSDEEIEELYRGAKALIFPTLNEDFGLVPLEANAHGIPVICHRSGGPLETLVEGQTAIFYDKNTPASLAQALKHYIVLKWSSEVCVENAKRFSQERFQKEFRELVNLN